MTYTREEAATRAEHTYTNVPGTCQLTTRGWFAAPSAGDQDHDGDADAVDGWLSEPSSAKHVGDRKPPRGVPVAWSGGSHGFGHRAISLGNGKIRSTDAGGSGHVATVDLGWVEANWGLHYLGWSETIDGVPIPTPAPPKPPKPAPKVLTVGTFNLLRGRKVNDVVREVLTLLDKYAPDALAVQEAEGYAAALGRIKGHDLFADDHNPENGVLVVAGRGSNFFTHEVGDGWTRQGGASRGPGEFPRVTVDDWCRIGSQHWPPSTMWKDGKLNAPRERVGDVQAWAEASLRFLQHDTDKARVLLSDYNETARTTGQWSPGWVAKQAGADIATAGGIDYGIGINCDVRAAKRIKMREKSDHDPILLDVVQK